jgi:hypothetical protein
MLYEAIAAALVALAVVALIIGPLTRPGQGPVAGADEPEDIEETPKGMALTALREIEFDRETGKLSDEDYASLKTKYTAEALAILRLESSDRGPAASPEAEPHDTAPVAGAPAADAVEALIATRVRTMQASSIRCRSCGPRPESDALFCSSCGRSLTVGGCSSCGAPLIPGSKFCEGCGTAVPR